MTISRIAHPTCLLIAAVVVALIFLID